MLNKKLIENNRFLNLNLLLIILNLTNFLIQNPNKFYFQKLLIFFNSFKNKFYN